MEMTPILIGKGLMRVKVVSGKKRDKVSTFPEVIVESDRVIFPAKMEREIMKELRK